MARLLAGLVALVLSGCLGTPRGIVPVNDFEINRYLGTWYEIARLDHSFERGLTRVRAEYSLRQDGGVNVTNKGYLAKEEKWKSAEGKAYFVRSADQGFLKVSFFGPFYGSYVVFELDDENYQYAYVTGPNMSYLWFLSRTKTVSPEDMERFVSRVKELGFDTDKLIFVDQS